MNKSSRTLVYSALTFAITASVALANPVDSVSAGVSTTVTQLPDPAAYSTDINRSGFSAGEDLATGNPFSRSRNSNTAEIASLTPETGKIQSFDSATHHAGGTGDSQPAGAEPSGPDANGDSDADTRRDLVNDASDAVSDPGDPGDGSPTTGTTETLELSGVSQESLTPEPSTLALAGSVLVGLGLWRRRKS